MRYYQRIACIVLAGLLLAPPSNWFMVGIAVIALGFALLMPSKNMWKQGGEDNK